MKLGAHDYLVKPFQLESLRVTLNRALDHYRLKQENRQLRETIKERERFEGFDRTLRIYEAYFYFN